MISQSVEYALRAVVTIANQSGQACTAEKIAEITQVPAPYLKKLMQGLVRHGLVTSQRGLGGGFQLSKKPDDLTVWEIVDAVEPFKRIRECPLGIKSHGGTLCPLHRRLDNAMEYAENMFRDTTVADLLSEPGISPLCEDRSVVQLDRGTARRKKKT